jgi:hypothetical protein
MATPILYRDVLYVVGWNGVLLAFDPTNPSAISVWRAPQSPKASSISGRAKA